jgi:hypothetical protein
MGRARLPMEVQRRFWALVRAGESVGVAAAGAGVSEHKARGWFGEAGGVMPAALPVAGPGWASPRFVEGSLSRVGGDYGRVLEVDGCHHSG